MSAARYVGRVGGLAVALGVGSLIVVGGVAYADTTTNTNTSGSVGVSHDVSGKSAAGGANKPARVKASKAVKAPGADSDATDTDTGAGGNSHAQRRLAAVSASTPQDSGSISKVAAPKPRTSAAVDPVRPTSAVTLTGTPQPTPAAGSVAAAGDPSPTPSAAGPVVQFDDGIIHGSVGTPLSGPVTYAVVGGAPGKVRMLGTGEFTYLPNYTDVATGAAERFSVRVTQQTPFVNALQQLPLIGLVVSQLLTSVREIPVLNGLLAPIIGSSVVVPVDVDLAHLVPAGDTVAYTYKLTSFDGTPISVNFFPALGLHTDGTAPSVVYGPGMTRPGDTDPYGQGFVGIGTMRSAGYNVITWDPRGEYDSGGLLQLDNPNLEGKDVSSIISWMANQPGVELDSVANLDPRMGMIGVSYGGGIQFATAANDKRIDAIVPGLAWNSLPDALYPTGAFKTAWASLLMLGLVQTGARINPEIYGGIVLGDLLGILTPSQLDVLTSSGPGGLIDNITAPTLIIQGTVDDLMPLEQAMTNVELLSDNLDANGNPLPVKMIWFCGGHGVCLDPVSPAQYQLLTIETLNWLDRYVKGHTATVTGPKFEWVDQDGQFYASDVMPTNPTFYGTPITDTGAGGFMPILPIIGGSGPLGSPLALENSLPIPTVAQNAINIPLALPSTGTTRLVGAPTVTVNYSGLGTSRFVYAQIVDNNTGRVVGNVVTPIPVALDGQARQVTIDLENIAYTAGPGDSLTLQLVASTTPYESLTAFGFINVSSVSVTLPTVGTPVVPIDIGAPAAA